MTDPRVVKELMSTLHSLHRSIHKLDLPEDCSPMSHLQMHTLLLVRDRGSCSMKELAQAQKIVPATMTALVDRLVKKNMLLRTADAVDRRITRVSLSPLGEEELQRFYLQKQERATMLLNILDAGEQETLIGIMKKIDKHFIDLLSKKA